MVAIKTLTYSLLAYGTLSAALPQKRSGLAGCVLDSDCGENQHCRILSGGVITLAPFISACEDNTPETRNVNSNSSWGCITDSDCAEGEYCWYSASPVGFGSGVIATACRPKA